MTAPNLEYLAMPMRGGKHGVFVVSDAAPDWYLLVALFSNPERATSYAEIENMAHPLEWGGSNPEYDHACKEVANAPANPPPSSAITVGNFVRRDAIEKTAPITTKEITPSPNEIKEIAVETAPDGITLPRVHSEPNHPYIVHENIENVDGRPLVDAATLAPLTPVQSRVFLGLVSALAANKGGSPTYSQIAHHSHVDGIAHHLTNLSNKGYIENRGERGAPVWFVLATGEPRVELPKDSTGRIIRQWTEEEIEGLSALRPENGDDYGKYAERVDRTLDAVMQKARTLRCFDHKLLPGYSPPVDVATITKPSAPAVAAPAKSNGHAISPAVAKELAKPAPVAPRGAPETRILTPVVRRVDLTKPRLPDANAERRMEILGDPAPGRSAADNDFDPKTYLIRKGHTVCLDFGGALRIDGKRYEGDEVIALVNSHRAKADLPPIVQGAA